MNTLKINKWITSSFFHRKKRILTKTHVSISILNQFSGWDVHWPWITILYCEIIFLIDLDLIWIWVWIRLKEEIKSITITIIDSNHNRNRIHTYKIMHRAWLCYCTIHGQTSKFCCLLIAWITWNNSILTVISPYRAYKWQWTILCQLQMHFTNLLTKNWTTSHMPIYTYTTLTIIVAHAQHSVKLVHY